ncbi:MAG: amino acid--[acyl-carrier-protein] ligase [Beijerinckiaceae bacterium]
MEPARPLSAQEQFLNRLFDAGILFDTGVDGLYGRSGDFENVIKTMDGLISAYAKADDATGIHFPPGMARRLFEKSGYMKSFPQLAGTVHSFMGGDLDHCSLLADMEAGEDWARQQKATDVVLTPAACYPLYPTVAKRGPLPKGGKLYDLQSYCFRHEPSKDPARMQMFRMREFVRIGSPEEVQSFRESWLERGQKMIASLELPLMVDVANDPFFGRAGKMMVSSQRDTGAKFELLVPVTSTEKPTACLSFNYHQNHFGGLWDIRTADGEQAHTACVGFGMERIALALFSHHGVDIEKWPASVRSVLWND